MMGMNMMDALQKIQANPKEFLDKAGVNVPEEMMNNPQAIVMHLIRTGQVSGPLVQRMMPMVQKMNPFR